MAPLLLPSNVCLEPCNGSQGFFWKTSLNVSVPQGQNVTLSCPLMPKSSNGVLSWYKQTPGQGPQLILSYNVTDTSELFYYSVASDEKDGMNQMFSRGLRLVVEVPHIHVDRPVTPQVHVLIPVGVQKQHSERVTLACVITGLQSKTVRITWKVNGATGLKTYGSSPQVQREPGAAQCFLLGFSFTSSCFPQLTQCKYKELLQPQPECRQGHRTDTSGILPSLTEERCPCPAYCAS
ncbi:hypothetical protein DPX16_16105 [Anabarilius grahami]|uniref:Ig-like domain-containing protein n=1 Tax=Anabarilius grahami TaxID=495550 RepID=A0A3N0YNF2_ANAGA|nr:hypothetical protein DPX16_16105 [Anabarilius grahami]